MSFCSGLETTDFTIKYINKLDNIYDKYITLNNNYQNEKSQSSNCRDVLKEIHAGFSSKYNEIISDLTSIIETIQNNSNNSSIVKKDEVVDEESPASIPQRKPNVFERLDKNNSNVTIEEGDRIISNKTSGWCTVKIRGSLENYVNDTLEVLVHSQGSGSDGSGFMFGVIYAEEEFRNGEYPGQQFFSFARHGTVYSSNNAIEGGIGSNNCGKWGNGDRLRLNLDPNTGEFTLDVNEERRLTLKLNITKPVCWCIGMYYTTQKVEILF